ncbi:MAG: hypothetical protein L0G63_03320 [Psychrobacter sp.]|uniref:hypothetical protein n=1 Tax=Psychrobacter sp. TaxID=56811 RepID=UPI002647C851|nr:hypothetical protein [Psychrobacter sp.]MDN5619464.1 hypothetical protein [Psychrobacter sp.]MDN5619504.1 hypothetical protein [Psychrobacter sp.]
MINAKERPIILTAQEVNAVLAGDKTQHRLPVLTAKEIDEGFEWDFSAEGDSAVCIKEIDDERQEVLLKPCPFGEMGERLWVQEPSLIHCDWDWFYADNTLVECKEPFTPGDLHLPWDDEHQEYIGPIGAEHMPRWASRLLLEIIDIRIESVRDINAASAEAEGCFNFAGYEKLKPKPLSAFITYWMAKYGDDAWWDNPWVWVIEFKVISED